MNKPLLEALDAAARSAVDAVAAERDAIRRDRDRLRRWLRKWMRRDESDVAEQFRVLTVRELRAALRGEEPPKGGTR